MQISIAYTGMRWSEAMAPAPACMHDETWDLAWKLYELDSRFYRGCPKDGSIRTADVPPIPGRADRRLSAGGAAAGTPVP